jgi:predicted unusual protein kinase regulating ubiquinone biosynthesis (AarF/ABC1/UbiB family)
VVAVSPRVLVADWLEGIPLSKVISSGTTRERDLAGTNLAILHFSAPARTGLLHADPHPGNFRLMPDGRLGVLDFGTAARFPGGLPFPIGQLSRQALDGDADAVVAGLRQEGFLRPKSDIDPQELLDFILPILQPLACPEFQFTRQWLRTEVSRVTNPRGPALQIVRQLNLPPSYLLVHRVTMGSFGVLCQLGAKAPYQSIVERWLPGMAPAAEK